MQAGREEGFVVPRFTGTPWEGGIEMALRVAVVGLGFGRTFARILNDHPECELVCVADLNEAMVAETARELRVPKTARTLEEVLALRDVEAVALFTHAPRHAG